MAMKGSGGGGGYGSRQHVEGSVRVGSGSKSARPAGVAQIGLMWGRHITRSGDSNYSGEKLHNDRNFQPTKFGNEIAANTVCGPGGSREVMRSGSQGAHGATNPGNPRPNPRREALEGE